MKLLSIVIVNKGETSASILKVLKIPSRVSINFIPIPPPSPHTRNITFDSLFFVGFYTNKMFVIFVDKLIKYWF